MTVYTGICKYQAKGTVHVRGSQNNSTWHYEIHKQAAEYQKYWTRAARNTCSLAHALPHPPRSMPNHVASKTSLGTASQSSSSSCGNTTYQPSYYPSGKFPMTPLPVLLVLTSCSKGITYISEDSSEITFLLVENYNYDCSCWSSDRQGIFDRNMSFVTPLFIAVRALSTQVRKSRQSAILTFLSCVVGGKCFFRWTRSWFA